MTEQMSFLSRQMSSSPNLVFDMASPTRGDGQIQWTHSPGLSSEHAAVASDIWNRHFQGTSLGPSVGGERGASVPTKPDPLPINIGFRPENFTADQILPLEMATNWKAEYRYTPRGEMFSKGERLQDIGRTGNAQMVSSVSHDVTFDIACYRLGSLVPLEDVTRERHRFGQFDDPMQREAEHLMSRQLEDYQYRVQNVVFNTDANYQTGMVKTLTGDGQWSNATLDVIAAIDTLKYDRGFTGIFPDTLVVGHDVWLALRTHPSLNRALHRADAPTGLVKNSDIAALLGLQRIVPMMTITQDAAGAFNYMHPKHAVLIHTGQMRPNMMTPDGMAMGMYSSVDSRMSSSRVNRFGFTAVFKPLQVETLEIPGLTIQGREGVMTVVSTFATAEIVANLPANASANPSIAGEKNGLGLLIKNAVA